MIKLVGAVLCFLTSFLIGIFAGKKERERTAQCEAFLELFEYVKNQVGFFLAPTKRIYQSFEPSLFSVLEKCCDLKPYVLEAVELLRSQGIKIGSTTGYTASMMKVVTECAKKQGYEPDCLVTPEETDNLGRPFPYMIFRNMQKLGIKSVKHVMKIGDTLSDIKEAKHAGVFAVGVTQGSSIMGLSKDEWSALSIIEQDKLNMKAAITFYEAGADFVINSLADIQLAIKLFESRKKK